MSLIAMHCPTLYKCFGPSCQFVRWSFFFKYQICFLFQYSHEKGNRSDVRGAVYQHGVDRDQGREDVHQPADDRLEDQLHVARREPHLEGDQEGEDGGGGGV